MVRITWLDLYISCIIICFFIINCKVSLSLLLKRFLLAVIERIKKVDGTSRFMYF